MKHRAYFQFTCTYSITTIITYVSYKRRDLFWTLSDKRFKGLDTVLPQLVVLYLTELHHQGDDTVQMLPDTMSCLSAEGAKHWKEPILSKCGRISKHIYTMRSSHTTFLTRSITYHIPKAELEIIVNRKHDQLNRISTETVINSTGCQNV